MRELILSEFHSVGGGEVGLSIMAAEIGSDVAYTGVYPHCQMAGQLAEYAVNVSAELMGPIAAAAVSASDFAAQARAQVEHNCIRTHGDPIPSLPAEIASSSSTLGELKLIRQSWW